jgi:plastocyanin
MKGIVSFVGGLLSLCVMGSFIASLSGQSVTDLRGTARTGDRPAPETVVWLDAPNAPARPQAARVVLDQRNLSFSPRVLVVRSGTTVDFPNNDRVFHNVFSFHDGRIFDLGMYPVGAERRVLFDRPGLSRVFCNIHPNMAAYVLAVDSPYFAIADESGAFAIASVPAGAHKYHAWRAGAVTELTGTWTSADGPMTITWP